jgi:hypothetical protein
MAHLIVSDRANSSATNFEEAQICALIPTNWHEAD